MIWHNYFFLITKKKAKYYLTYKLQSNPIRGEINPIYLFKDRGIHLGNSSPRRDPWDSFSRAAGWEYRELLSRAICSQMRGEGTALSCKDKLLFRRREETGQTGI